MRTARQGDMAASGQKDLQDSKPPPNVGLKPAFRDRPDAGRMLAAALLAKTTIDE
jgi:hypothetical protein